MSIDILEGYDYYPTNLNQAGLGVSSTWIQTGSIDLALVDGRFLPGKAYRYGSGNNPGFVMRRCETHPRKVFGFAFKPELLGNNSEGVGGPFMEFRNSDSVIISTLNCNILGEIRVVRAGNVVLGVSDKVVLNSTWHYIELIYHAQADGLAKLYIDGELQFTFAGNLSNLAGTGIDRIVLRHNFAMQVTIDDMYVLTDESVTLGQGRIQLDELVADFDVDWTPNPAGSNAANVDELSVDGDTTYNATNTVGAIDYFDVGGISGNPETIHAVSIVMAARKEDSGTRIVRVKVKSGADVANGADEYITTDYTWSRNIFPLDPQGNVPWTKERYNAFKPGYELVL